MGKNIGLLGRMLLLLSWTVCMVLASSHGEQVVGIGIDLTPSYGWVLHLDRSIKTY